MVAVRGEHLFLPGRDVLGVQPFDAAHDQPGGDVLALGPGRERRVFDFGYLGFGDPPLFGLFPDRLRVLDPGPRVLRDAGDRRAHACVHLRGHRVVRPGLGGGGDDVTVVVRAVSADRDQPARPGLLTGGDRVTDHPGCPVPGCCVALA